jgi:hypothetical protein
MWPIDQGIIQNRLLVCTLLDGERLSENYTFLGQVSPLFMLMFVVQNREKANVRLKS